MRSAHLFLLCLLTFTLLLPHYDEPARLASAQQNTVILWTGQAKLTHKHSATEAEITVTWSRTADLDFSVDSRRQIDPKTRTLSHTLTGEWRTRQGAAATIRHDKSSVDKQQIDLAEVEMSVKTCAAELSAPVAGLADNTLGLNVAATPDIVYRFAGAGESRAELALIMRAKFPYDYRETQLDPPEVDVPQMQTAGFAPVSGVGAILNPPTVPAKMKVTMTRKPLKLEYQPLKTDMIESTRSGQGYSSITSNFARGKGGRGGWFIHGNSRIQVMVDKIDASTSFSISRWKAESIQRIDGTGRRIGQIRIAPWHIDTQAVGGLWIDIPGQDLTPSPGKWPQERYMQEYLVGVSGFPEFGGLYFIVVIDTKPNWYRVRMYPAKTITIDQWCSIKSRTTPYQNEASSGSPVDSGWQPAR